MKEIKAFIHSGRISEVLTALNESGYRSIDEASGCRNICVSAVQSLVRPVDETEKHYSMELAEPVVREWKLELFCEDQEADALIRIVEEKAGIGKGISGWIFVTDIVNAIPIVSVRSGRS